MADYNLHGLNTRDFQHMVQAIARKQIASGVNAFGDGKDGNRDLTFSGKMNYPSLTSPWDGYLILGCKFCQRPTGDSKKDGDWAIEQLEADLKKFLNAKGRLRRPDYYLFTTNVALTAVAEKGSRDRVNTLLSKYAPKLRFKGYGVWDYNDIRGFLDGDQNVRLAYGHLVTAGDVLARMVDALRPQQADFVDVMHAFLQKELIADAAAKLQSAGEDPDVQIPLASVFVDLPYADSPEAATLAKQDDETKAPKVVQRLLETSSVVSRRRAEVEQTRIDAESESTVLPRSRFVIVGGPGQGKSTLGQYLCQLHRASILKDRPPERLDEHVPGIVKQLEKQRRDLGGLPVARRFPIRIELRTFSFALGAESQLTLLEYIRRDVSRLGSANLSIADLKAWLEKYPWLLVLDGLDEVPPSSNRADVMKQIEHFRVDAASRNADLMLLATTRPQSYSQEFAEDLFRHLYLMPLSPKNALSYGRKLAESRCGGDERRRDELIRSLEKACKNEATARLMQSPLQVTIMATLIEDTGEPPQQRYRLFAEYYRTIYRRETRHRLLRGILSERQTDIDTIHAHAGLLLHIAGETASRQIGRGREKDIESALSDQQFRELVRTRLEKIKVPPGKAAELLKEITDGTLQRLVFLVRPREGWIRFDLTSLKEFMAAEAIMTGADQELRERLAAIAPASYWRNVFLFAVGKCFVQREHLLDALVGICTDLNEETAATRILGDRLAGRAAKATMWGARLALDILTDGTARQYPEFEVRLARLALGLVRISDVEVAARLAAVWHDDLSDLYREVINDRFGQNNFWLKLGTWNLLLSLTDRDVKWANELCEKHWPTDAKEQAVVLASREHTIRGEWWIRKVLATAPRMQPWWLNRYVHGPNPRESPHYKGMPETWKIIFRNLFEGPEDTLEVVNHSGLHEVFQGYHLTTLHLDSAFIDALGEIKFDHPAWFPQVAGARFAKPEAPIRWLANYRGLRRTGNQKCDLATVGYSGLLRHVLKRPCLKTSLLLWQSRLGKAAWVIRLSGRLRNRDGSTRELSKKI